MADNILAIWVFVLGIHLLLFNFDYTNYYLVVPHLLGFLVPLPLVHGPLLLLYVTTLISGQQKFNKLQLLHFGPALIFYLFLMPIMLLPAAEKLHVVYEILPDNAPLYFDFFYVLIVISGPVYIVWSLILLRKHYRQIKENFSYTEKINLKWLRNLCIGMAVIWMSVAATSSMDDNLGSTIIYSSVTLFVFLIGYYGIRQGVIFTDPLTTSASVSLEVKEKYEKSPLDAIQSDSLLQRLLLFMEKEKPYLESKITLPQLANQFDTNPNYLSQIINESLNQNLYDFINKYRVNEFKERLKNKDALNYTLFGLAQNCGFSSKSTFYDVFKKHTGQTPAQYQSTLLVTTNY